MRSTFTHSSDCRPRQINAIVLALLVEVALGQCCNADIPEQYFESKVRPLLVEHCIACHGGEKPDAGLSLESREGWKNREVIVPASPTTSLLIQSVRYQNPKLKMPPEDSGSRRLSESEINILEKWIADGAVDPRTTQSSNIGPQRRNTMFLINEQDRAHWAYQPIKSPYVSDLPSSPLQQSEGIDRIVDEKLQQHGLTRNRSATPRELVRRAYFDLWGLPPEPSAVAAFESNPTQAAWAVLIDRLLASHYYGERWGRYWLDWVRYAETNGYERDGMKLNAWRYRDYVIGSFNADKPYDRFLLEQLAGDFLIESEKLSADQNPQAWREAIIATGYYRLHVWDDEPDNSDVAELDDMDDIMITTGAAFMGMTLGCARCHDHKFDPLSQVDYYSLLDLFRDIDPYGLPKKGGGSRGTGQIERFLVSERELREWQEDKDWKIGDLKVQLSNAAEDQRDSLRQQLKQQRDSQPPFEKALAINVPPSGRKPTFVLARGDYQSPGSLVHPQLPELFRTPPNQVEQPLSASQSIGNIAAEANESTATRSVESVETEADVLNNRYDLAKWLTNRTNPLTARVLANRTWLKHFGAGIVSTPDDFGYTGIAPSNIELLDLLASQLMHNGWSIKSLHRSIMLSQTYQMSSHVAEGTELKSSENSTATAMKDPENRYFWRQNLRRLDAEAIRDSMPYYSGTLHPKRSGPSVYFTLSQEIRETANPVSLQGWGSNEEAEQVCRSVFLVVKRSLRDPLLESFDFANSHSPVGQRAVTTVAPQALMMLNDSFVQKQAEKLATKVLKEPNSLENRIELLWRIVYQRAVSEVETATAEQFIVSSSLVKNDELLVWTSLCRALLNSNECIYID